MNSKNHENNGYNLVLELLTILYYLRVSYPRRNGVGQGKVTIEDPSTLPIDFVCGLMLDMLSF